jgi:hypothetical protein
MRKLASPAVIQQALESVGANHEKYYPGYRIVHGLMALGLRNENRLAERAHLEQ